MVTGSLFAIFTTSISGIVLASTETELPSLSFHCAWIVHCRQVLHLTRRKSVKLSRCILDSSTFVLVGCCRDKLSALGRSVWWMPQQSKWLKRLLSRVSLQGRTCGTCLSSWSSWLLFRVRLLSRPCLSSWLEVAADCFSGCFYSQCRKTFCDFGGFKVERMNTKRSRSYFLCRDVDTACPHTMACHGGNEI